MIVADNGSDDGSAELARGGALVVHEPRRGYGSAYLAGFAAAHGDYIVMADADLTYDFADIPRFVERLDEGADLVMGDRMRGIQPGTMPWLHRYIGNPVLTGILNLFFRTGVSDAHCGMRAIRRSALPALDLRTTGMEFASEMVIRAGKERLAIEEIPIPTTRARASRSCRASATAGATCASCSCTARPGCSSCPARHGAARHAGRAHGAAPARGVRREWDLHSMVAGALLMIVGTQVLALGLCAHAYGTYFMGGKDPGSTACGPASGSSTACCSAARRSSPALWWPGDRGHLGGPRLRRALRGAARGTRGDADHRRHPDLLLVVPLSIIGLRRRR